MALSSEYAFCGCLRSSKGIFMSGMVMTLETTKFIAASMLLISKLRLSDEDAGDWSESILLNVAVTYKGDNQLLMQYSYTCDKYLS